MTFQTDIQLNTEFCIMVTSQTFMLTTIIIQTGHFHNEQGSE
jgi:hypothetical protein